MKTCASILCSVKWNIGRISRVPFETRNARPTTQSPWYSASWWRRDRTGCRVIYKNIHFRRFRLFFIEKFAGLKYKHYLCINKFRHASFQCVPGRNFCFLYTMDYTKQPLDYPQILQMLKGRGLIVRDEIEALRQLKIISYFRLANYMRPMEADKVTHIFKPGRLFENFGDKHVKKIIAREFNLPQHLYLESWIKSIVVLRNCIAHHSRIWNRKFPLKPQLPLKLNGMWIDCSGIERAKLYAQLCCLVYLQNQIHPDNDFKQQLKSLLKAHPNVDVAAMGFPVGWENEPLWR